MFIFSYIIREINHHRSWILFAETTRNPQSSLSTKILISSFPVIYLLDNESEEKMLLNRKTIILSLAILMLTILACDFSFNTGDSEAEQTLQAIYIEQTMAVMDAEEAEAAPEQETVAEPTATIEIIHSITPGTPGWVSQWWLDTDSSSTASQKRANGGDALNINLLERPFTAQEMDYRPDLDLQRVEISYDTNFYYFLLTLDGLNPNTNTLSAFYGVELDIDKDSRGDLLLWALGDGSTQWNIADVYVYSDNNDDVGGPRPMLADAPSSNLDGYETALFSPENLSDPDAAWKRVDPGDATVMQLAIKKSLMNNASTFMWSAWADDGVKDAALFDYNDQFTLSDAGSPISGVSDYPLKALYLADNTCRLAYGYEPTGDEPNICQKPVPTATPRPTDEPEPEPPCECPENRTFINDKECCEYCGFTWGGTSEFPCY